MLMGVKVSSFAGAPNTTSRNFSYSGSWEPGTENWTGGIRGTGSPRTGSYKMSVTNGQMTYAIPNPGIVNVTVKVYHRGSSASQNSFRAVSYKRAGAFLPTIMTLVTNSTSTTYALIQGTFTTNGTEDYTIYISGGGMDSGTATIFFDDWSIDGVIA